MSKKIAKRDYWKVVAVEGAEKKEYLSAHINDVIGGRLQYYTYKYTRATPAFAERGYHPLVFTSRGSAFHFRQQVLHTRCGRVFKCRCRGKITPSHLLPQAYLGRDLARLLEHILGDCFTTTWWDTYSAMAEEVMLLNEVG